MVPGSAVGADMNTVSGFLSKMSASESLSGKLNVLLALILLANQAALTGYYLHKQRKILTAEFIARGNALAQGLGEYAANRLPRSGAPSGPARGELSERCLLIARNQDIAYAALLSPDGRVLVTSHEFERTPAAAPRPEGAFAQSLDLLADRIRNAVEWMTPVLYFPNRILFQGREIIEIAAPVRGPDGHPAASARLGVDPTRINNLLSSQVLLVFMVTLLMTAAAVVLMVFTVDRFIRRPLRAVMRAAGKIAEGDLSGRIAVPGRDEIGQLAASFNRMSEELDKKDRELKEAHAKLLQSTKMAAVGQLAGGVAHEINNPLVAILGFAQMLAQDAREDDPDYVPLKSIEQEAKHCRDLIQDLLTFSRTAKPEREPCDVNETVESALRLVEVAANRRPAVKLVKDFASGLPKALLNRNQVQQVVVNLCNNALDALGERGCLTVRTRAAGENGAGGIEIQVQDDGAGMPKEIQSKIFEPFFTTKDVGRGTGLGLSIVYEIVSNHQGSIEVESEAGRGSLFRVRLPLNAA